MTFPLNQKKTLPMQSVDQRDDIMTSILEARWDYKSFYRSPVPKEPPTTCDIALDKAGSVELTVYDHSCADYFSIFLQSLASLRIHCNPILSLSSWSQISVALSSNGMKRLNPSWSSLFILGQHICSPQLWLLSYFASSADVYTLSTVRPEGEEKFTFIPPEIDVNFNSFGCNFDKFPIVCGGIKANKNIDLGWNFQFYTEIIPAVLAK